MEDMISKKDYKLIALGLIVIGIAAALVLVNLLISPYNDYISQIPNSITVQGESKITVVPDILIVNLDIVEIADTPSVSQNSTHEKSKLVINKLKEFGVEDKDIKTIQVDLNQEYDYTKEEKVFKGYKATNSIEVRIRDINNASKIMDSATSAGASNIWGMKYEVSDRDAKYNEALEMAVKNAKDKANAMLNQNNSEIDSILNIQENRELNYPVMYKNANVAYSEVESSSDGAIMQGEQEITASVTATFKIKD